MSRTSFRVDFQGQHISTDWDSTDSKNTHAPKYTLDTHNLELCVWTTREIAYLQRQNDEDEHAEVYITTTKKNFIQSHIVSSMFATHVYYIRLLTRLPQTLLLRQSKAKKIKQKKIGRFNRIIASIDTKNLITNSTWYSIIWLSMMGVKATMEIKREIKAHPKLIHKKRNLRNGLAQHTQFNWIRDECESPSHAHHVSCDFHSHICTNC